MNFETIERKNCLIIKSTEEVNLNSDISELYTIVDKNISLGKKHFAISFKDNSFLYTPHIAVLVKCLERVKDIPGTLSILHPNKDIADVLFLIDQEETIKMVDSEEELSAISLK